MYLFRSIKTLGTILVVLIVAGISFAFAASNTVPPTTYAGDGTGTISGYNITDVEYNLNATTPSNIDSVTFTLDEAASEVYIRLDSTSSTYYSCTINASTEVTCNTTAPIQAIVEDADILQVIASN